MGKNLEFLLGLGALILCTQLTGTLATSSELDSWSDVSSSEETSNNRGRSQVKETLNLIKAYVERLKEKQRSDVFNPELYGLDRQLRRIEYLLKQEDERRDDQHEFPLNRNGENTFEFIHNNDFEAPSPYLARRYREEKNLRTPTARMNNIEQELTKIRTTQEELLRELRIQSVFQIQMKRHTMEALNEIKEKKNRDEIERTPNAFSRIDSSIENLGGQVDSLQFSMNELIRSTQENDEEMKSALADATTGLKAHIVTAMRAVGGVIAAELNRSMEMVLEGQKNLYHNRTEMDRILSNIHLPSNDSVDKTFEANVTNNPYERILDLAKPDEKETFDAIRGNEVHDNERSAAIITQESQPSGGVTESVRLTEGTRPSETTEKTQPNSTVSKSLHVPSEAVPEEDSVFFNSLGSV